MAFTDDLLTCLAEQDAEGDVGGGAGFQSGAIYKDVARESADEAALSAAAAEDAQIATQEQADLAAQAASNAADSEAAALLSETAADASETAAAGSAVAAAASAVESAADAADAADTALAIDKLFLGHKEADPTTDNQGGALAVGAWYFNTLTGTARVWGGVTFQNMTGTGVASFTEWNFTATAGQDEFTVDEIVPYYIVAVNGLTLPRADFTAAFPTITLAYECVVNDEVVIIGIGAVEMQDGVPIMSHNYLRDLDVGDYHTQYLPVDGSRGMGGTLVVEEGGADITEDVAIDGDLTVTGTAYAVGGHVTGSDARIKSEVAPIGDALGKLSQVHGVSYRLDPVADPARRAGVLAQEVLAVFPEAVTALYADPVEVDGYTFPQNTLAVDPMALIGLLVSSVNELAAKVQAMESKL